MRISKRRGLLLLIALAFVLRLAYLLEIRDHPLFEAPVIDAFHHHHQARVILDGDPLAGSEPFWKPPFYSFFLAALLWFVGPGLFSIRLVQILLGTLSCVLTYYLGERTLGSRAGWIGAVAMALYGPVIFFDGEILMPSLIVVLNLSLLLVLTAERMTVRRSGISGLLLGFSAITRPDVLLFGIPAALFLWIRPGRRSRRASLAGAFILAVAVPVGTAALRNYAVSGEKILVSANGGSNFYIGNHPAYVQSSGMWSSPGTRLDSTLRSAGIARRSDADAFYYRKALEKIRSRPLQWFGVLVEKTHLLWNGYEISNNRDIYRERESSRLLSFLLWRKGMSFPFGFVMPFAALGIILSLRRWREQRMLLGYVVAYSVGIILFFVTARYRIPLVPVLLVFAGHGASSLIDHARAGRWKTWAPLAAMTVAAFGLINSNPGPTTYLPPLTEEHLAIVAIHQGRSELAEDLLLKAIEEREQCPRELIRLASVYEGRGEIDEAVRTLESIEEIPDIIPDLKSTAHFSAARTLAKSGRAEDAIPHWRRVVEIDADSSYYHGEPYFHLGLGHFIRRHAWVELGKALESLGRLEDAATEYRAHLRLEPRAVEVLGRLALVAVELEEYEEAVQVMKRYLEIQPEDVSGHDLLGVALEGLGDLVGAEKAYRRCLEVYPAYAPAYLKLAGLYVKANRVAEAGSVLESCLEKNPDHGEAAQMLREIQLD